MPNRWYADKEGQEWRQQGACLGMDPDTSFFSFEPEEIAFAKQICHQECPVREECLSWAITNNQNFGVWGGMDPDERFKIKKSRQQRASRAATR
jgi:WhiB family redox-sensing transcriptional regulator